MCEPSQRENATKHNWQSEHKVNAEATQKLNAKVYSNSIFKSWQFEPTQRQDAEGLLNLHPNLLNAKQQGCNQSGGWDAEQVGRVVQREGHQGQPCIQKTGGVPASSQLSV